jgi:exopolysaccharide biosynthesis polyprenyl glycosylphosphotransferase
MEKVPRKPLREDLWVTLLCAATDALLVWYALNLATLTRIATLPAVDLDALQRDRIVMVLLYLVSGKVAGSFEALRLTDRFDSVYYAGIAIVSTGVLAFLSVAILPRDFIVISRREIAIGILIAGVFLAAWRYLATELAVRFGALYRAFLVLGSETEGRRLAEVLTKSKSLAADARYLDEAARTAEFPHDSPPETRPRHDAIICLEENSAGDFIGLVAFCEEHCRRTFVFPSLSDALLFQHSKLLAVGGVPLIEVTTRTMGGGYMQIKRAMDVAAAVMGILITAPLCLAVAFAIKRDSPGPAFYTQERIGLGGKRFNIYKFRTMVEDAEEETGPVLAVRNDPRTTPLGRVLRQHRIDEIPQLFNVLKGDMSLVGPRPERPFFHEQFSKEMPLFDRRLLVRPGVTSLSHVLGSYGTNPAIRLRYDLIYIGTLSFLTDLNILFNTVRVVLGGKGAH